MGVKFVYGDLLKTKDVDVVIHQVNCFCIRSHGLSRQIAEKYPWADIYSTRKAENCRNLAILEDRGIPGTIRVFKSPQDLNSDIVCFLSQWDFGKVNQDYRHIPPYKDTRDNRLHWFCQCLEQLSTLNISSAAIPHNIGCGLGGGDWTEYYNIISTFAKKSKIEFKIYIPSLTQGFTHY